MLTIQRLRLQLRATTLPGRSEALQRRLQDALERALPGRLQAALPAADPGAPGALLFIDRIELGADAAVATVGSAWDDERIVDALARALARALAGALARGEGRRFDDRAGWLAAYLAARAEGTGGDRHWSFDAFDGLRALPLSAALRTVIVGEPAQALAALGRLAPPVLARLADALADADLLRIFAAWQRGGADAAALPGAHALWQAATAIAGGDRRALFRAAVATGRQSGGGGDGDRSDAGSAPAAADSPAAMAARLPLLAALADLAAARPWPVQATAAGGDAPTALRTLCRACGVDPGWVDRLDAGQAAELCATLLPATAATAPATGADGTGTAAPPAAPPRHSAHGGAFVLLAVLGWTGAPLRWQQALAADPRCADGDSAALARALALAVVAPALAPATQSLVWRDAALRQALALADAPPLLRRHAAALAALLRRERLPPAGTAEAPSAAPPLLGARSDRRLAAFGAALLVRLGERVPGGAGASAGWLRRNLLAADVRVDAAGDGTAQVLLGRAPLHVLLLLAGLTRTTIDLPGRRIAVETVVTTP
jgi:hypothetical protein